MKAKPHFLCVFVLCLLLCCSMYAQNGIRLNKVVFVDLNIGIMSNDTIRELYCTAETAPWYIYITFSISAPTKDSRSLSENFCLIAEKTRQTIPLTFCCSEKSYDGRELVTLYGEITERMLPRYNKLLVKRFIRAQKLTKVQSYIKRNILLKICEMDNQPPLTITFQNLELMIECSYEEKIEFHKKYCGPIPISSSFW